MRIQPLRAWTWPAIISGLMVLSSGDSLLGVLVLCGSILPALSKKTRQAATWGLGLAFAFLSTWPPCVGFFWMRAGVFVWVISMSSSQELRGGRQDLLGCVLIASAGAMSWLLSSSQGLQLKPYDGILWSLGAFVLLGGMGRSSWEHNALEGLWAGLLLGSTLEGPEGARTGLYLALGGGVCMAALCVLQGVMERMPWRWLLGPLIYAVSGLVLGQWMKPLWEGAIQVSGVESRTVLLLWPAAFVMIGELRRALRALRPLSLSPSLPCLFWVGAALLNSRNFDFLPLRSILEAGGLGLSIFASRILFSRGFLAKKGPEDLVRSKA